MVHPDMIIRMRVGHPKMNEVWDPVKEVWYPYLLDPHLRDVYRGHDIGPWDAMWFTAIVNQFVVIS
jgi:hypothetical protein